MYPVILKLEGQVITIIGGGKVAYRKAKTFLDCGGKVNIIAPQFDERFHGLDKGIVLIHKCFEEEDLKGNFIVVAATDDKLVNHRIGTYCKSNSILCNVIDNIDLSTFIVPASMKQGDLIISVSTSGKSPSLAAKIKKELSEQYNEEYIEYLELLGRVRQHVVDTIEDENQKKEILRSIITLNLEELKTYEKSYFGR